MYKPDLALNNPQWLMCHQTKQIKSLSKNQLFWSQLEQSATFIFL